MSEIFKQEDGESSKLFRDEPKVELTDGGDLSVPTMSLLYDLNLLPSPNELTNAGNARATFGGPPQSVALIEAGATAVAKWWSTAGGAVVAAAWGSVTLFWGHHSAIHAEMLWAASIVTAALVLAIATLLATDVRGRAAASVATIQARADVAAALLRFVETRNSRDGEAWLNGIKPPPSVDVNVLDLKLEGTSLTADEKRWLEELSHHAHQATS